MLVDSAVYVGIPRRNGAGSHVVMLGHADRDLDPEGTMELT